MADSNRTATLLAAGDIAPLVDPSDQLAQHVLPALRQADLRFAQCERTFSERHGGPPGSSCLHPRVASVWATTGIEVLSMASNHTMDAGAEAMQDTVQMFRGMGKHVVGVGRNEQEARAPAIVERNGIRIAFLAYCSVITEGHEAAANRPGMAPMRAYTYYERGKDQQEEYRPGTPPLILTVPDQQDLRALQEDIRKARQHADVVVMSIHWGIHMIPKTLATYQTEVAHAAIDAGADLILGHHAHCLKAIEVYKGKVCFYSLGNFMMPSRPRPVQPADWCRWNLYWYQVEDEYLPPNSIYSYPPHCRMTMLAKIEIGKRGVQRVSYFPAYINPQAQPEILRPDDPRFRVVSEYVAWVSDPFATRFHDAGDEIVVDTTA